jgi:hypothetical protein
MSLCQYSSLGMLMYYDANPTASWCGLFDSVCFWECRKPYYSFKMFNELYKLGDAVELSTDSKTMFGCAATNGDKCAVMVSYFDSDENAGAQTVKLDLNGFSGENGVKSQYYLIDEDHNLDLIKEEVFKGDSFSPILELPVYASYLITLEKIKNINL